MNLDTKKVYELSNNKIKIIKSGEIPKFTEGEWEVVHFVSYTDILYLISNLPEINPRVVTIRDKYSFKSKDTTPIEVDFSYDKPLPNLYIDELDLPIGRREVIADHENLNVAKQFIVNKMRQLIAKLFITDKYE